MRRRILLVGNQAAGRGKTTLVDRVIDELRRRGAQITLSIARSESGAVAEASEAVRTGAVDAVVAAGGDGTIRLLAKAVAGSSIPIGIIPQGTGNVLAHELALPRDPTNLAQTLLHGPACSITTATANGEPFLLMAGVGFDGRVIGALDHRLKLRIGKLAYTGPSLRVLCQPPDRLTVWIDGEQCHATWAIVANACRYGGGFVLAPRTHVLRPGLEAILFRGETTLQRLEALLNLARGRLDQIAAQSNGMVSMQDCTHVRIESREPVPSQIDGDKFMPTPLEIRGNGSRVWLIVPNPDS